MKVILLSVLALIVILVLAIKYAPKNPVPPPEQVATPKNDPAPTISTHEDFSPPPARNVCDALDVISVGNNAIKAQLKAPATAQFAGYSDAKMYSRHDTITMVSYVDAQNAFGALLRNRFAVVMICHGGELTVIQSALE